jgi:hypothetical protein
VRTITLVANVQTDGHSMRSKIDGTGMEDPRLFVRGKPIGLTPSPRCCYLGATVLEMLADGWRLLGPPRDTSFTTEEGKRWEQSEWWLTLEVAP